MNKPLLTCTALLVTFVSLSAAIGERPSSERISRMHIRYAPADSNVLPAVADTAIRKAGVRIATVGGDSTLATRDSVRTDSVARDSVELRQTDLQARIDSVNRRIALERSDSTKKDSTKTDTLKSTGILAPVTYEAKDSMVYDAKTGMTYLYGTGAVNYQDMSLTADEISMNIDQKLVHATHRPDSVKREGRDHLPLYKQGDTEYRSESMSYNFATKQGFIENVYTKQGEGFMQSARTKRDSTGLLYLEHAKYTTCDEDHPHFYIALSRAKVRPGKEVIFGPAYLVVADVPLPLAIPYGFFPFTKKYSSGIVMPSYGDESSRGFYLRDGGYYFAINDKIDLKLLGEIYTKGSWGLSVESNYRKRYRYSGNFYASYLSTVTGDKNMPDYSKTTSLKVQWRHTQDAKASPNRTFSASVNFASQSYERSNLMSQYNPLAYTQSTRASSVSYSHSFPNIGLTLSTSANITQNMRDSSVAVTLPDLTISLARFYPFKRKKLLGKERWYEKISVQYTGHLTNSITTKEDKLFSSNLVKDWKNAMYHQIPVSATFNLLNYINVTPTFNFNDRTYSHKTLRSWDASAQREVADTVYGFYNVYDWAMSVSANTTLYGFYTPWRKLFGDKIIAIRHVVKPSVSFSYTPDFSTESYGYYGSYVKTDALGNVSTVNYSPFEGQPYFGVPTSRSGNISMSLSNNLEMKLKSKNDSTGERKVSLIDELSGSLSYNLVNKRWSDLSTRIRLKLTKSYTFSLAAVFATYAYKFNESGQVIVGDRTEWSYGRFGRFQGMSQNFSYTINNATFAKLFGKKKSASGGKDPNASDAPEPEESNMDPEMARSFNAAGQGMTKKKAEVDSDGYLSFEMPWSISFSYGVSMREDRSKPINTRTMRYPFSLAHTANFSGNIRLAKGWNINWSSGYDFDARDLTMTTASVNRDMHCFSISCSMVLKPYTSYNLTLRASASQLADLLKWEKRSSYSSNIEWY